MSNIEKEGIAELKAAITELNNEREEMQREVDALKDKLAAYRIKEMEEQVIILKGNLSGIISQLSNATRGTTINSINKNFMETFRGGVNRAFKVYDEICSIEDEIMNTKERIKHNKNKKEMEEYDNTNK